MTVKILSVHCSRTRTKKVELYRNGESQPVLIPWTDSPSGKTDRVLTNRQKIEVRGDMLGYYMDDTYIGEMKSELDMKEWSPGLTVCGNRTIAFDRFKAIER